MHGATGFSSRSVGVRGCLYSVLTASIASTPDFSHKTALLSNKCR